MSPTLNSIEKRERKLYILINRTRFIWTGIMKEAQRLQTKTRTMTLSGEKSEVFDTLPGSLS